MANLVEVLITSDTNNTLWTCCIWDPKTGTSLMTYKGGGTAETQSLSFIAEDYLAAVEKSKPVLHIWPLNSHQTVQGIRFILPGKANALAFTRDGAFCIAGIEEKIYLWQMSSGNLLAIINRHYQKVIQLKFTGDDRFFVSAAEDGMVMVWALPTVSAHPETELMTQTTAGQFDPVHIFSDHSLPVTSLFVSKLGMCGRLATVSSDRTCKIYDLTSGELLLNLVFDSQLTAVTMDALELNIFIGTSEGSIHQFCLTNPPRNRDLLINCDNNSGYTFSAHTKSVMCLSASVDGETLVSGGNDEQVILWDINSKQPLRIIKHKGPITNSFFTVNKSKIYKQDFSPTVILKTLERTLDKDTDNVREIEVTINKKINFWPKFVVDGDSQAHVPSKEIESAFEQKEMAMKEEIDKLKKINANLYQISIQKTLNSVSVTNDKPVNHKKQKVKKMFKMTE